MSMGFGVVIMKFGFGVGQCGLGDFEINEDLGFSSHEGDKKGWNSILAIGVCCIKLLLHKGF
ncbi:hypothetical protein LguiA_015586 [Lonicera macranthoides]